MDTTDLLPAADAARTLEVDVATVNRWAAAGTLQTAWKAPGLRGARFFTRAEVDRIKAEREAVA